MKRVFIAEPYKSIKYFVDNIDQNFESGTHWIKDCRNKIKLFNVQNHQICVKSFYQITAFNRLIYSFFRKSKAERSFLYAQRLQRLSINTPDPVAYVETYSKWGILKRSYYICLYNNADFDMAYVLGNDMEEKQMILKQFVLFMSNQLHMNGVKHNDFNGSNVLINKHDHNNYDFSLIDLNRIQFKKRINHHHSLRNMQSISSNPMYLTELARHYASLMHVDENETIYELLFVKYLSTLRRRYTKRVLHSLRTLF